MQSQKLGITVSWQMMDMPASHSSYFDYFGQYQRKLQCVQTRADLRCEDEWPLSGLRSTNEFSVVLKLQYTIFSITDHLHKSICTIKLIAKFLRKMGNVWIMQLYGPLMEEIHYVQRYDCHLSVQLFNKNIPWHSPQNSNVQWVGKLSLNW